LVNRGQSRHGPVLGPAGGAGGVDRVGEVPLGRRGGRALHRVHRDLEPAGVEGHEPCAPGREPLRQMSRGEQHRGSRVLQACRSAARPGTRDRAAPQRVGGDAQRTQEMGELVGPLIELPIGQGRNLHAVGGVRRNSDCLRAAPGLSLDELVQGAPRGIVPRGRVETGDELLALRRRQRRGVELHLRLELAREPEEELRLGQVGLGRRGGLPPALRAALPRARAALLRRRQCRQGALEAHLADRRAAQIALGLQGLDHRRSTREEVRRWRAARTNRKYLNAMGLSVG
jgi:hypothetical protein